MIHVIKPDVIILLQLKYNNLKSWNDLTILLLFFYMVESIQSCYKNDLNYILAKKTL